MKFVRASGFLELITCMRLKRILLPALCLVGTALIALPLVHAAGNFGLDTAAGSAGLKKTDLLITAGNLIKTLLSYLGIVFLLLTLYAGFLYMTAQGDEKKVKKATDIIKSAVTGIIIVAASYTLTSFVLGTVTNSVAPPDAGPVTSPEQVQ